MFMSFFLKNNKKLIVSGAIVLFLLLFFISYILLHIKEQQRQNFLKLDHELFRINQRLDTNGSGQVLPAENSLKEAEVNSVVIGNIQAGNIHSFDDSFSLQVKEVAEMAEGVELSFNVFNRDGISYKDLSLKFQADIRIDNNSRQVESKTVFLPGIIEAGGRRESRVVFSQADVAGDVRSLRVFVGE
jgi:hypothetical protein